MSSQINSGSGSGGGGGGGGIGSGNGSAGSGDSIGSVKMGSAGGGGGGSASTPPHSEVNNPLSTLTTTTTSAAGAGAAAASTTMTTTTTTTIPVIGGSTGATTTAGMSGVVPSTTDAVNNVGGGGGSGSNNMAADCSPRESGEDESEDESEILEESPCGRWLKRREEVDQRDVPGIDCVHLAMDTEEGVEVVWNEVQYASLQELKSQEEKMRQVFDNLLQLDHQNIVKFHRYWTDTQNAERPRVIFITEYMSSGSLKQFLKRTKRNAKRLPLEAWRRWCTQILSALSYLHSCIPPVIHGNLTCDSIFIQHNGLVKIGSVVPDAVHYSVRQQHKIGSMMEQSMLHFMAPEYGSATQLTAAVDIYAFGMCALEMAALEIQPSGSGSDPSAINDETILRTINSLEHDLQRDLIFKCLRRNPSERPSASDLLFHPLLFEVHSLKLLAAHCLVFSPKNRTMFSETVIDAMLQRYNRPEVVLAKISCSNGEQEQEYRLADVPSADKLEKFVEDVKYGVYPLTAFSGKKPPHFRSRAASPERADSVKSATPEPIDVESRRIVNMMCSVKKMKEDCNDILMTILLRMDDKMNRQLTCQVTEDDSALDLTSELVRLGFVHIDDQDKIQALLEETLRSSFAPGSAAFEYGAQPLTFSATINEHPLGSSSSSGIGMSSISDSRVAGTTLKTTTTMATALNQLERNWSVAESNADSIMTASSMGSGGATNMFTPLLPQTSQMVIGVGGASTTPIVTVKPKSTVNVVVPVPVIDQTNGGGGGVVPYMQQVHQQGQQQQQINETFGGFGTDAPYTTIDGGVTLTAVVPLNEFASSASSVAVNSSSSAAIPSANEISIATSSASASATASTIN